MWSVRLEVVERSAQPGESEEHVGAINSLSPWTTNSRDFSKPALAAKVSANIFIASSKILDRYMLTV